MRQVGIGATVLMAIVALGVIWIAIASIPELRRYIKMERM